MPRWIALVLVLSWIFWAGRNYFTNPNHVPSLEAALSGIFEGRFSAVFGTPLSLAASHVFNLLWIALFLFIAFHAGDFALQNRANSKAVPPCPGGHGHRHGPVSPFSVYFYPGGIPHSLQFCLVLVQLALLVWSFVRHKKKFRTPPSELEIIGLD